MTPSKELAALLAHLRVYAGVHRAADCAITVGEIRDLMAYIDKLEEVYRLAAQYAEACAISEQRANSEEFWATAGADDVDEIDLEETLARLKLLDAVRSAP